MPVAPSTPATASALAREHWVALGRWTPLAILVDLDGTVVFVSSVSAGIDRYRMNLRHPDTHKSADGRILNDFLRRKHLGDSQGTYYLAGRLFAAFGTLAH